MDNLNDKLPFEYETQPSCLGDVSGSLQKQEVLQEILDYIDSYHGSGHQYWYIISKIEDKVRVMLERSKSNDR